MSAESWRRARRHAAALDLAGEYARLVDRGDVDRAGQVRQTIEHLVGRYVGGFWRMPADVVRRMGWSP